VSRVRSWLAAPMGARLLGVAFALAGVALLVLGVFTFGESGRTGSGAPPSPSASATVAPTTGAPTTTPTGAPSTSAPSTSPTSRLPESSTPSQPTEAPAPVRLPLTVLNNSTVRGLGERAAGEARAAGWTVVSVGNFAGVIPVTTVYYTPGDPAQRAAAEQLKIDLPKIQRVMPRYEGLPPTPTGVVLVVTRDWA
jgi:hypothetical protein